MGFGTVIALGESNTRLDADLAGCLAEVRVEQSLDAPMQYAVRFLDDIENGRLRMANDDRLAVDTLATIAVEVDDELTVLVRGPITEHRSQMTVGGPGSWFEIRGLDRADLLDRACEPAVWTGRASDAAREILTGQFDRLEIEATDRVYEPGQATLNQRETDLDFLLRIARRNNRHFWITYATGQSPIGSGLDVTETAHLASSPRRPEDGALGAVASAVELVPTTELELRVHVPSDQCPNVTAFQVNTDGARPSRYRAGSMPTDAIDPTTTEASDPQPPAGEGTRRLAQAGAGARALCMPGSGDPQDTQARAEAALTEAGWFVQATASTSRHLLGGVIQPHDVLNAVGVGPSLGQAAFRVKTVTHVINATEHFMDATLESNSLGDA